MISEIYGLLHTWLNEVFDENMSLGIWQYIYGADVITSRSDIVNFLSEVLSVGVIFALIMFVLMTFGAIFKLVFGAIKWR